VVSVQDPLSDESRSNSTVATPEHKVKDDKSWIPDFLKV
jgi:hypothetical protein